MRWWIDVKKLNGPVYDITTNDGIQHTLWLVDNDAHINSIENLFETKVPSIYVADGHHRTAAGALVGQEFRDKLGGNRNDGGRYNYFMAVVFPDKPIENH